LVRRAALSRPENLDISRRTSDLLAEAVAHHPVHSEASATLAPAKPDEAARELERCVKTLGFKGRCSAGAFEQTISTIRL
jgi:predicted TIM-barrel fold metal-dependent hydrolase